MPQEFTIEDHLYRTRQKMNARQQFHIARRLAPLIGQIIALGPLLNAALSGDGMDQEAVEGVILPFATVLSRMSDEECDYVLDRCLAVVQRREGNGQSPVWVDIWNARANALQFQDIELPEMLRIASEVLRENLQGFLPTGRPEGIAQTMAPTQPPLSMSNG